MNALTGGAELLQRRWLKFATMLVFSVTANTPLVAQPVVLGALVEQLHLSQRDAGVVVAAELVGLSLGLFTLVLVLRSGPTVRLAILSALLILGANIATAYASTTSVLLLTRAVAGIGAAAAFAIYLSMAAADRVPERAFATIGAASLAWSGATLWLAPKALSAWGLAGLLAVFSGIAVVALAATPGVRAHARESGPSQAGATPRFSLELLPLLTMIVLLYAGHGAIWAYQERLGDSIGLSTDSIAQVLAVSMFGAGMAGSLLAGAIGLSLGRVWPQVISLLAAIGATVWLVFGDSMTSFSAASAGIAFSWMFGLPYQFGLLAACDRGGRAVMTGVMLSTGGMALGPAVAAQLVKETTYAPVATFAVLCYIIALAISIPAAQRAAQ